MTRENVEAKGRRYLAEGRLTVERVDLKASNLVVATCRGSDTNYRLGYDPNAQKWRCTCPAKGRCAHLVALQLVTTKPRGER